MVALLANNIFINYLLYSTDLAGTGHWYVDKKNEWLIYEEVSDQGHGMCHPVTSIYVYEQ